MKRVYDFGKVPVSKESILEKVTEQQIYEFYLGESIFFNKKYKSPYREDNNPSLSLMVTASGTILWRDWGDPYRDRAQDIFNLVMAVKDCPFSQALQYINTDMGLGLSGDDSLTNGYAPSRMIIPTRKDIIADNNDKVIEIEKQTYTREDRNYWAKYGIDLGTLIRFNVFSVKYVWLDKTLVRVYSRNNPVYAFKFDDRFVNKTFYKIYCPLANKRAKWLTNAKENIIQGIDQVEFGGAPLIITKSLKDVIVLYKMGYRAIAPQSENTSISSEKINRYKSMFGKVIIFYDNDEPGIMAADKFSKRDNLDKIFIPIEYKVKDISDYVSRYGLSAGKQIIKTMITNASLHNNI